MRRVLVVIHADREESARALEGLRMSVGLALAENEVEVVLRGSASGLLDDAGGGAHVQRRAGEFLGALGDLGGVARCGGLSLEDVRRADVVIRWGSGSLPPELHAAAPGETVVFLNGNAADRLPGCRVLVLGVGAEEEEDGLRHEELLDLIFECDSVVTS